MKKIIAIILLIALYSCGSEKNSHIEENHTEHTEEHTENIVELPENKVKSLQLKFGKLPEKNINNYVLVYGELAIPPQNRATLTPVIGANVKKILVIEGDKVKKGQTLAYLSHPDIIQFQTEYLQEFQKLEFLKQEYERQKKLYDEKISSGKKFQKVKSEYLAQKGIVEGYEQKLRELNLNPQTIKNGKIIRNIPIISPINGYVEKVSIHVGQYVNSGQEMFDIVNTNHIHLHLRVFEEDVPKIKVGQKIIFTTKAEPNVERTATVYSVGKLIETEHNFTHVHAHIDEKYEKSPKLLPGMYVKAKIITESVKSPALPEAAITMENDKTIAYVVNKKGDHYEFTPVEIKLKQKDGNWYAVEVPKEFLDKEFLLNNAYYVYSESQKGSMEGHAH